MTMRGVARVPSQDSVERGTNSNGMENNLIKEELAGSSSAGGGMEEVPLIHLHHHHEHGNPSHNNGNDDNNNNNTGVSIEPASSSSSTLHHNPIAAHNSDVLKLIFGAGGIYAAFLYYGSLMEDVFSFTSPKDGSQFKQAWFLQVLEAGANIVVGFIGMHVSGATPNVPKRMFAISGAAQVSAKACTSLALANGLSFPVATLAKSGKMAPVMAGTLFLGGAEYSAREYLQVAAIIGGTAIVSMGKKKSNAAEASNSMGIVYIILALALDGVTAGYQRRLQRDMALTGVKPGAYDFMFWTNLFMGATALVIAAIFTNEMWTGLAFCLANPEIFSKIIQFSICSAVGQSFIFYTLAHFDPLVLATVTTTRKIFSVLLSIFFKGHSLSFMGWAGVNLASLGIFSELQAKMSQRNKRKLHIRKGSGTLN